MRLSLDWNCVIEVEEGRPQAAFVDDLIHRHRQGELEVALLAASASENTKSKRFPGNAGLFQKRVSDLGWQDLPLVPMPGVWDLCYYDFSYYVDDGDQFERDMDALWSAIAPKVPREPSDHLPDGVSRGDPDVFQSEVLSKWRNTWCDVVSAYSHIKAGRDIFVTNNTRDFQNNSVKLFELGMQNIAAPQEAMATVVKLLGK